MIMFNFSSTSCKIIVSFCNYFLDAVLKQKEMKNCPGLEWTLDCNPPCLHQLQYNYSTSSPACHVTYTTGNSTYTQIFKISNGMHQNNC